MNNVLITCLFLCCISAELSYSQTEDIWTAFEDRNTGLYGFKDPGNSIRISPKYSGLMLAKKFSDIVAVLKEDGSSNFLLKNGREFGHDSALFYDIGFDCESEGFIRFYDRESEKTGIFNSEGIAVIPAEYDVLTQMMNGMSVGLKGAKKEYMNNDPFSEIWEWKGGTEYLIDKHNNILAENFRNHPDLDFHSLIIMEKPSGDPARESYCGVDGKYYTFINNLKLFELWLGNEFLDNLNPESVMNNSYEKIIYWTDDSGWRADIAGEFIDKSYNIISNGLSVINDESTDYFISPEDFIICPEGMEAEFEKYQDNCGKLKSGQYPVMDVIIDRVSGDELVQDHFGFLKTEAGFKLLTLSIP